MSETFEIRSKSFTIKWINIPLNSQVKWKIRPLKNSINLGFYQQKPDDSESLITNKRSSPIPSPSAKSSLAPNSSSSTNLTSSSTGLLENLNLNEVNEIPHRFFSQLPNSSGSMQSLNSSGTYKKNAQSVNGIDNDHHLLEEKLEKYLIKKAWIGKCPADSVKTGSMNIKDGGLYAFVFDNTFSKTKAKTVIFEYSVISNSVSQNGYSNDIVNNNNYHTVKFDVLPKDSIHGITTKIINIKGVQYLEGYLMKKKRRKSGKNFIKRFFSLNLTYAILYYYSNDNSNTIRGNMMITQTVISADSSDRMLYLDSGMEQWVLKANNAKDFNTWVNAFNFLKTQNKKLKEKMQKPAMTIDKLLSDDNLTDEYDDYGNESEYYVDASERASKFSGNRVNPQFQVIADQIQKLKELVEDVIDKEKNDETKTSSLSISLANSNPKNYAQQQTAQQSTSTIESPRGRRLSKPLTLESSSLINGVQHAQTSTPVRKPSFLYRLKKKGTQSVPSTPDRQSFDIDKPTNDNESRSNSISSTSSVLNTEQQSDCNNKIAILTTVFDSILCLESEYKELVRQESDSLRSQSRIPLSRSNTNAKSLLSQEFYDAQEFADETDIGVVMLNNISDENIDTINIAEDIRKSELSSNIFKNDLENVDYENEESSLTSSSEDEPEEEQQPAKNVISNDDSLESLEQDLYPLPYNDKYEFRNDIKPAACEPPSLTSILRKGIGKDLTSMAMPISTNEPLSFLQKYTETLEYSNMINEAMSSPMENGERILRISTFAISFLSSYKDKIRSIRKPFNPLLGETFELIRPDLNIRAITEKVIHKPFVMAAHIDSDNWYIDHAICPQQKFYGKTAEISVDGTLKLKFRNSDEIYEWNQPTTTLRNVVSLTGEKYTEPTENITVKSNTGLKCVISFISENGRFTSSRSEKVELKVYSENIKDSRKPLPLTANGSWTNEIKLNNGKLIWKINPELPNHEKKYGFTKFSCSLNNIDEIHQDCAPTDSRRRPDQKLYENGNIDEADELKLKLEEDQRLRRKDLNGNDVEHKPQYFERGSNDLDWKFIRNSKGYWNRRKAGDWDGSVKLW